MKYGAEWNFETASRGLQAALSRLWMCVTDKNLPVDQTARFFAWCTLSEIEKTIGTDTMDKIIPGYEKRKHHG